MNSLSLIKERARLYTYTRNFFQQEGVLEVDTPLLYPFASPEPYLDLFSLKQKRNDAVSELFLQSSPEFCMKRLISETNTSIYQLCKAFRREEHSIRHLIEFTMLEWYMLGWNLDQLSGQIESFLKPLLGFERKENFSYSEVFSRLFELNPLSASLKELRDLVGRETSAVGQENYSRDECLHLLFAEKIEKNLDPEVLTFIHDFPASQAALAKVERNGENNPVAKRFEVFFGGMELANAYQEESTVQNLRKRFEEDNRFREEMGKESLSIDESLLADMEKGFPECAGVALGIDRLLMLMLDVEDISDVVFFR